MTASQRLFYIQGLMSIISERLDEAVKELRIAEEDVSSVGSSTVPSADREQAFDRLLIAYSHASARMIGAALSMRPASLVRRQEEEVKAAYTALRDFVMGL